MNPLPKKIGIITSSFPRNADDFAGRFVFEQAKALSQKGYSIEVITPQTTNKHDFKDTALGINSLNIFPAPYFRPRSTQKLFFGAGAPENIESKPILKFLGPAALAGLFATAFKRARRWDAVISHWLLPSALAAGPICRFFNLPHLAQAHSGDVHLLSTSPGGALLARAVLQGASSVGFVTNNLRNEFQSLLGCYSTKKTIISAMGFDPNALKPSKTRESLRTELELNDFTVLFLGRLVPIKGLSSLIHAMKGHEGATLIVAGDGPERQTLEKDATEKKVKVRFLGKVSPKIRANLLAACDIMIVPSLILPNGRHEGLPLAIIEAMATGLPVGASRTGGIDELVINEKTGLLFEPGDTVQIAGVLDRMANDQTLANTLSKAGRNTVANRRWSCLANNLIKDLLLED